MKRESFLQLTKLTIKNLGALIRDFSLVKHSPSSIKTTNNKLYSSCLNRPGQGSYTVWLFKDSEGERMQIKINNMNPLMFLVCWMWFALFFIRCLWLSNSYPGFKVYIWLFQCRHHRYPNMLHVYLQMSVYNTVCVLLSSVTYQYRAGCIYWTQVGTL